MKVLSIINDEDYSSSTLLGPDKMFLDHQVVCVSVWLRSVVDKYFLFILNQNLKDRMLGFYLVFTNQLGLGVCKTDDDCHIFGFIDDIPILKWHHVCIDLNFVTGYINASLNGNAFTNTYKYNKPSNETSNVKVR